MEEEDSPENQEKKTWTMKMWTMKAQQKKSPEANPVGPTQVPSLCLEEQKVSTCTWRGGDRAPPGHAAHNKRPLNTGPSHP